MTDLSKFLPEELPEPGKDFEPLPVGGYTAVIAEAVVVANKAGTGHILKLKYQILDGNYEGRVIFDNLNIDHPNEKAKAIALIKLSEIQKAIDKKINDSSDCLDIPMLIEVSIQPASNGYPAANRIKKHKPFNNAPAPSITDIAEETASWKKRA